MYVQANTELTLVNETSNSNSKSKVHRRNRKGKSKYKMMELSSDDEPLYYMVQSTGVTRNVQSAQYHNSARYIPPTSPALQVLNQSYGQLSNPNAIYAGQMGQISGSVYSGSSNPLSSSSEQSSKSKSSKSSKSNRTSKSMNAEDIVKTTAGKPSLRHNRVDYHRKSFGAPPKNIYEDERRKSMGSRPKSMSGDNFDSKPVLKKRGDYNRNSMGSRPRSPAEDQRRKSMGSRPRSLAEDQRRKSMGSRPLTRMNPDYVENKKREDSSDDDEPLINVKAKLREKGNSMAMADPAPEQKKSWKSFISKLFGKLTISKASKKPSETLITQEFIYQTLDPKHETYSNQSTAIQEDATYNSEFSLEFDDIFDKYRTKGPNQVIRSVPRESVDTLDEELYAFRKYI